MTQTKEFNTNTQSEKNSKLLTGVLIGAVIGGAVTMIDSTTRSKVTTGSRNLKDSTMGFVSKVKDNPSDLKNGVQQRLKSAADTLKNAMNDAQNLYEKVNEEVVPQVEGIRESTSDILSTAQDAKDDLKNIGSQVAEAGNEVTGENESGNTSSSNPSTSSSSNLNSESRETVAASPKNDIPGKLG